MKKKLLVILIVIVFLAISIYAQAGQGRGRMTGSVKDQEGNPVANATITLEFDNSGKKFEITTNAKGEWALIGLGTGHANMMVLADGFLPATQQVTVSQLNRNPPVDFVLIVDLEKKARLKDDEAVSQLEQGNALFNERKYQEALAVFNQFSVDNPNIYHIYLNIGDSYREMQDYKNAILQYETAIEKAKVADDTVIQAKAQASIGETFLRQNDLKSAQEYFKKSLDLNPKDELLAYNVAEIYFNNQKVDDAIAYYLLATQVKPDWGLPFLKLGYAYLNKADYEKAIDSFNKFLQVDPKSDQAPVAQAVIDSLKNMKK
ncbi:MAG: tetratricopeptide repeat protein [Candidatus Aminicenantes bacterium]|nr:tetratricopeptide repeat protein [Candidatus Aminicenantes bacterium]